MLPIHMSRLARTTVKPAFHTNGHGLSVELGYYPNGLIVDGEPR